MILILEIVISILIILLIFLVVIGFYLASYSMKIDGQTLEEALDWQMSHYDLSWFKEEMLEPVIVKSFDDYELHTYFLRAESDNGKYVIISHGYTDNHYGALKYADIYRDMGFNIIIYDLRGHGSNEKTFCTYSVRERKDLMCIIEDTYKRYGNVFCLGIHGESLGAATSIAVLEYNPQVRFVVCDCGFSDIVPVLKNGLKHMHLPEVLVNAANICAQIKYGFSYKEMKPIDSLANSKAPVLYIHGGLDDFIFPWHTKEMYDKTNGYKEYCLIENAGHAGSVIEDHKKYKEAVEGFLTNVLGEEVVS